MADSVGALVVVTVVALVEAAVDSAQVGYVIVFFNLFIGDKEILERCIDHPFQQGGAHHAVVVPREGGVAVDPVVVAEAAVAVDRGGE